MAYQPKRTVVNVSYAANVKANLGNYESADARLGIVRGYDVSDAPDDFDVDAFEDEVYLKIKDYVDTNIEAEYKNMKGIK